MGEGIGARLRSARERSRLTILQAAEKLHVDPDILEALEAENFAALGAQVYVKGHLRHYAQLVGESPQALFDLYAQGARAPRPDLTRIAKPLPRDPGRLVAPAVIVVIGFAAAGTVWWVLSLSHGQWSAADPRPVPVTVAAAMPAHPAAQPVRLALSGGSAKAAAVAQGSIDVVLSYSGASWTEVYDATGRRLLYGLSSAHARAKLEGVPPLSVMLGDASDVSIEVGGHPASISRFVRSDHTARFLIAADGRALAAPRKNGG